MVTEKRTRTFLLLGLSVSWTIQWVLHYRLVGIYYKQEELLLMMSSSPMIATRTTSQGAYHRVFYMPVAAYDSRQDFKTTQQRYFELPSARNDTVKDDTTRSSKAPPHKRHNNNQQDDRCEYLDDDWQKATMAKITCNILHEIDLSSSSPPTLSSISTAATPFWKPGKIGAFKQVWSLVSHHLDSDTVVFKTDRKVAPDTNLMDYFQKSDHKDALVMDQLSASPHILNIHGYCHASSVLEKAHSTLYQWWLEHIVDKAKGNLTEDISKTMIEASINMSMALWDMQLHHNATDLPRVVHRDLKPDQFMVSKDNTLKLNDFNMAHFVKVNPSTGKICPFQDPRRERRFGVEQYRDRKQLTDKVDIAALGAIFFWLLTGEEMYAVEFKPLLNTQYRNWNTEKITLGHALQMINDGILSPLPSYIEKLRDQDPYLQGLINMINACRNTNPDARPTPLEIATSLTSILRDYEEYKM